MADWSAGPGFRASCGNGQTLPPRVGTGAIGSYVNRSAGAAAGGVCARRPSPAAVFAPPSESRYQSLTADGCGGNDSTRAQTFRPVTYTVAASSSSVAGASFAHHVEYQATASSIRLTVAAGSEAAGENAPMMLV